MNIKIPIPIIIKSIEKDSIYSNKINHRQLKKTSNRPIEPRKENSNNDFTDFGNFGNFEKKNSKSEKSTFDNFSNFSNTNNNINDPLQQPLKAKNIASNKPITTSHAGKILV